MFNINFKSIDSKDLTITINQFLSLKENNGKAIFFPQGKYEVDTIILPSNIQIIGEIGTEFILKPSSDVLFKIKDVENIIIDTITLNGENKKEVNIKGERKGLFITNSKRINIKNVRIHSFDNSGIYVTKQGYKEREDYSSNTFITNCRIEKCNIGMCFDYRGEYSNIMGVTCGENYIGCFNAGGNNMFSNCQFNNNTLGYMLQGGDEYPNNSHSSISNSQFNHNISHSLYCKNANNGFIFTACQFFDGKMQFEGSSNGIIFSACEGGMWEHVSNQTGEILFIGNFFQKDPQKTFSKECKISYINNIVLN